MDIIWLNEEGKEYVASAPMSSDEQKSYIDQRMDAHSASAILDHPDSSVTDDKIGQRTVGSAGDWFSGTLNQLLNKISVLIKAITGEGLWTKLPESSIKDIYQQTEELDFLYDYHKTSNHHDNRYYTKPQIDECMGVVETKAKEDAKNLILEQKGMAGGIATLDETGKVPNAQLPSLDSLKNNAFITVAAANSTDFDKSRANHICTGENDQQTILEAKSKLPNGGTIYLCAGDYYFGIKSGCLLDLGENITLSAVKGKSIIHSPEYTLDIWQQGYRPTEALKIGKNTTLKNLTLNYICPAPEYDMLSYKSISATGDNIVFQDVTIDNFAGALEFSQGKSITLNTLAYRCYDGIYADSCDHFAVINSKVIADMLYDWYRGIYTIKTTNSNYINISNTAIVGWSDNANLTCFGSYATIENCNIDGCFNITGNCNTVAYTAATFVDEQQIAITGNYNRAIYNTLRYFDEYYDKPFEVLGNYNRIQNNCMTDEYGLSAEVKIQSGEGNIVLGNQLSEITDNGTDTIKTYTNGNYII